MKTLKKTRSYFIFLWVKEKKFDFFLDIYEDVKKNAAKKMVLDKTEASEETAL